MSKEKNAFQPLETCRHIRVVELVPSSDPNARLCFNTYPQDLDALSVDYTAVSYAWGDVSPDRLVPIEIDHCQTLIPPTLHTCLVRLRSLEGTGKYIWADALCINQSEDNSGLNEKSLQVGMMGDIFSKAEEVIVDLGEANFETEDLIQTLDKYYALSDDMWRHVLYDQNSSSTTLFNNFRLCSVLDLPGPGSNFWALLRNFIRRPWFRRVWIIQEYALAHHSRFLIGRSFRPGDFLSSAILRATRHLLALFLHYKFHQPEAIPNNIGNTTIEETQIRRAIVGIVMVADSAQSCRSLCELLAMTAVNFKVSKDCDRVYALLSLVGNQKIKQELGVDYTEPLPKFTLRLSRYLLQHASGKYMLYHSIGDRGSYVSWAFGLANPPYYLPDLIHPSGNIKGDCFHACGGASFTCKMSDIMNDRLVVRGCTFDSIEAAMTESLPHYLEFFRTELDPPISVQWETHALEWMCNIAPIQPLPEKEFRELCWRTTIADLMMSRNLEEGTLIRLQGWPDAERYLESWDIFTRVHYLKMTGELPKEYVIPVFGDTEEKYINDYTETMMHTSGFKLALSRKSKAPCLVPADARIGDCIVIIQGCEIPFILRRKVDERGDYFRVVGCAYVHGVMDGEPVDTKSWQMQDIEIR